MRTPPRQSPHERRAMLTLRELLKVRDMRGAELARRAGYSPQTLSNKLNGQNLIDLDDAHRFGEALNVDPGIFLVDPEFDYAGYTFGLTDPEFRFVISRVADDAQREAGFAALEMVAGVTLSLIGGLAAMRVPSLAPVLEVIRRESTDDEVMSGDELLAA